MRADQRSLRHLRRLLARVEGSKALWWFWRGPMAGPLAYQVIAQVPSCRTRPGLPSGLEFKAAARLWSQALFLVTPR